MPKKAGIDKLVKCDFCGRRKKESAMLYFVEDDCYYCSQACADKQARLEGAK